MTTPTVRTNVSGFVKLSFQWLGAGMLAVSVRLSEFPRLVISLLKSVKCYPDGREIHLTPSISEILHTRGTILLSIQSTSF